MTYQMGHGRTPGSARSSNESMRSLDTSNITAKGNVKVVVRIRPENKYEAESGQRIVVKAVDEHVLVFDPKVNASPDFFHGRKRKGRDLLKKKNKDMRFAFDRVFDMDSDNETVYENTTRGILDGLLDGYNCSVFAYGATGAGKTFSMLGSIDKPGVIFYTMMDLYKRIEDIKEEKKCEVACSYLEVYNEQIRDLLTPTGYLPIREDPNRGVVVSGLSLHQPPSAVELLHMLEFGNKNRTQHPTDANAESSRSHAVFQVFVRQKDRTANVSADVRVAKMSLIDLAGSERATVTKNRGARFREGANINKSLLALGNCINALADPKYKGHVPYRNSKLTRLLKDSLGGNCRTIMIAAVSPSAYSFEDTYNTLNYANRAKNIRAELKRNVVNVDFHLAKYTKIISDLRQEVTDLKTKLSNQEQKSMVTPCVSLSEQGIVGLHQQELERSKSILHDIFKERSSIRKELLELEASDRDLTYKITKKEITMTRIGVLSLDTDSSDRTLEKLRRSLKAAKKRQNGIRDRKLKVQERMQCNEAMLKKKENEVREGLGNEETSEIFDCNLRTRHLEVELRDTKRQVKFLKKLGKSQNRDSQTSEKLISTLLRVARKQYFILKGHSLASSDIVADYEAATHLVEEEREVAWADQSMNETCSSTSLDADSTGLDLVDLMNFPVFSCVSNTPKTPKKPAPCSNFETPASCKTPQSNWATPVQRPDETSAIKCVKPSYSDMAKRHTPRQTPRTASPPKRSKLQETTFTKTEESVFQESSSGNHLNHTFTLNGDKSLSENSAKTTNLISNQTQDLNSVSPPDEAIERTYVIKMNPPAISIVNKTTTKVHTVNSGTVTKSLGQDAKLDQENIINSSTITKVKGTTIDQENMSPLPSKRANVVRAMKFASPMGSISFADAVKSPGKPLKFPNEDFRSPLATMDNLKNTMTSNHSSHRATSSSSHRIMGKSVSHHQLNANRNKVIFNQKNTAGDGHSKQGIDRFGLSSLSEMLKQSGSARPGYMQATKAFQKKNRTRRSSSLTSLDRGKPYSRLGKAQRLQSEDNSSKPKQVHKPQRIMTKEQSQSQSNLNKRGFYF